MVLGGGKKEEEDGKNDVYIELLRWVGLGCE